MSTFFFERKLGVKDLPLYVLLHTDPKNCNEVSLRPCDNNKKLIPNTKEIIFSRHDFLEKYEPV